MRTIRRLLLPDRTGMPLRFLLSACQEAEGEESKAYHRQDLLTILEWAVEGHWTRVDGQWTGSVSCSVQRLPAGIGLNAP